MLPVYFGLEFLVTESRLAAEPELAAELDRLESSEGRLALLEVTESIRLRAMLFQHNVFFKREQQLADAAARYLGVVKKALLNEHYLESEARTDALLAAMRGGKRPSADELRDPARFDKERYNPLVRSRTSAAGPPPHDANSFYPFTAMGRGRLDHLESILDELREGSVAGDLVECGTGRGGGAIFMRAHVEAHEDPDRVVWVADPFRSAPPDQETLVIPPRGVAGFRADLNMVREGFDRFDLLDDRVRFLEGPIRSVLPDSPIEEIALLMIGRGIGADTLHTLRALYDRLTPGGVVLIDEAAHDSVAAAVEEFRAEAAVVEPLTRPDEHTVAWRKSTDDGVVPRPAREAGGAPAPPPVSTDAVDLSVVVVFYNMRREAERTLRSLSRAYQEGIGDRSYEVVVVENGSSPDERLGDDFVRAFGPEFRYIDMGETAQPSPVPALNRGIAESRGEHLALMIDGAHVLTPGVLHFGLTALETYAPAIVATQQWYVGPGQQGDAMQQGYDQDYEDRLFERINWPHAGYRLFEISHFVGDRDWLDGVWESNCMFVPRSLLEQVGGFDEAFSVAGGGYANLELYERLGNSPDVTVCSILGEASFHQVHGGTTTNQIDAAERRGRVFGYAEHYAQLRGRAFRGPGKPLHFVGRMPSDEAKRTKARRQIGAAFAEAADHVDGMPSTPTPMPDELRVAFTEAVWKSLPWRHTTWMGHRIETAPTDLLAYQEIITDVRPDWIVETGAGDGSRSLFLAGMCELVGHGHVVAIDPDEGERPDHPRLQYLTADADSDEAISAVTDLVGSGTALVVLGSRRSRAEMVREFEAYASFVPVDGYVVVADTVVNGNPVWPGFGPGPAEGVKQALGAHGEFIADPLMEKYSLTFNPGGFLRRVR